MTTTFIYVLIEQETKTILYVGKSKQPIRRCGVWQRIFRIKYDCEIEMILLDHIDHENESDWEQLEINWIFLFRETHQIYLLNKLSGGNAPLSEINALGGKASKGMKRPSISKARLGKPMSELAKLALSKARSGKKYPNISKATKGKRKGPMNESHKLAISKAKSGTPISDNHKRKMSRTHAETNLVMNSFHCKTYRDAQTILKLIRMSGLRNG